MVKKSILLEKPSDGDIIELMKSKEGKKQLLSHIKFLELQIESLKGDLDRCESIIGSRNKRRSSEEKSNLEIHAETELALLGGEDEDIQKSVNENILKMVRIFSDECHSGFSASYTIGMLTRLLKFENISPLTGADSEWNDVSGPSGKEERTIFQNNRMSSVFKEICADGHEDIYEIGKIVFTDPIGSSYTSSESSVPVSFPYISPDIKYINVDYKGDPTKDNVRRSLVDDLRRKYKHNPANWDEFVMNLNLQSSEPKWKCNTFNEVIHDAESEIKVIFELGSIKKPLGVIINEDDIWIDWSNVNDKFMFEIRGLYAKDTNECQETYSEECDNPL